MNKKLFFLSSLVGAMFISVTLSVTSLAWFTGRNSIDTDDKLGGSVLQSYFHAGDGKVGSPFTITTPWHYENFVKLHYNVKGFAEKGYYFEFGDKILGSETPVFFKTDTHGVVDRTATSTTLNLGGMELTPLGTNTKPFFAQLDGNNLTVTNFTVNGKGYNDVGIFGYVASAVSQITGQTQQAKIENCYWNNFTIQTKESSKGATPHSQDSSKHPDKVEVGYLAGHVVAADSFSNCYVNDCEIKGSAPQDAQNNTFSYYGKAEKDSLGGETGKGHDYEYHMDSEYLYRSINSKYETYKNAPIRARTEVDSSGNTIKYAEYDTPLTGDADEIIDNGTYTVYPTGTSRGALVQNGSNQYDLKGAYCGNTADRNYSFSSLGYQPLTSNSTVKEYEAFYYDSNNKPAYMPENVSRQTSWDNTDIDFSVKDQNPSGADKTRLLTKGQYHYFHKTKGWQYVENNNDASDATDSKPITFNLSISSSFTIDCYIAAWNSPSIKESKVYLYIDGTKVIDGESLKSASVKRASWSGNASFSNVALKTTSSTKSLQRGRHYYAFFVLFRMNVDSCKYISLYDPASGTATSGTSVSYDSDNTGHYNITQGTFTVTQDMYDSGSGTFNIGATSYSHEYILDSTSLSQTTDTNKYVEKTDMPVYVNSATLQKNLYGTYLKDGTVKQLTDSAMLWRKDEGTNTEYDDEGKPISVHWYKWIGYYTPSMEVDKNAITQYFADDPNITTYYKDGQAYPGKGYKYTNMDIVGGGISFFYQNYPLLGFDAKVIAIKAERSSAYSCKAVPTADITNGAKFYATKYCPTSIVLYLKNTANAADDKEHELGNIDFQYVNLSSGGSSIIDLSIPSFKKGNANFVALDKFGKKTGSSTIDYRTTYSCNINETGAKACCYCALDKDRNILGVFNSDGTPSTGFVDGSGNPIISKLLAIDTYVLALGANTNYNLDISAWVTKIDFKYKAEEGYGGTFGTVGYRDRPDTINNTILNFNYNLPDFGEGSTLNFSIRVKFIKKEETISEVTYSGHYLITVSSSTSFALAAYNYDTANYYVIINTTSYFSDRINVTIPAT